MRTTDQTHRDEPLTRRCMNKIPNQDPVLASIQKYDKLNERNEILHSQFLSSEQKHFYKSVQKHAVKNHCIQNICEKDRHNQSKSAGYSSSLLLFSIWNEDEKGFQPDHLGIFDLIRIAMMGVTM